ncbi:uncharacterized protein LOC111251134 [Varroa destructor]|uniref:Isobutyryl-CoA dehydrogenase, mitochondrial n=1 Tax=Varroa destructor TaxID=109461 RepID=A0A7M7KMK6_VARDE|nr:uncharacterized protein LOC111251134 [Varroa destructor]
MAATLSTRLPRALCRFNMPCQQSRLSSRFALDDAVGLDEQQIQMQQIAKDFALKEWQPNMRRWDQEHIFPREALRAAASLGFAAIRAREEFGGSGLGCLESVIILEALARGCTSTTAYLSIHNMTTWMIDTFGNEEQRAKWVPKLARMEFCSSYCLTEASSGSDSAALVTKAVRDGDFYILNGSKAFISGAGESDLYVCMVRTGGLGPKGISCLVIEKDTAGISFGKSEEKLGWNTHPTRAVIFEDCRVPVANLLGEEGQGFTFAMKGINNGRLNMAACSVGAAAASIEFVVEYIKQRKQFGKAIAEFQFNQFRIAEMATKLQASRLMVHGAARCAQEELPNATAQCAMAKYFATETCFEITNNAIQLMGGYGFIKDFPIQQYFRDGRIYPVIGGTNEVMRLIISRDILKYLMKLSVKPLYHLNIQCYARYSKFRVTLEHTLKYERNMATCLLTRPSRLMLCRSNVKRQQTRPSSSFSLDDRVGLNEEQLQMQTIARNFTTNNWLPNMRRWDQDHIFPREALRAAAALGFGAIRAREEFGGSGLGNLDAAVIFEALARGCTSTAAYLSIHNMATWMVDTFGNKEQRSKWIPKLASMEFCSSYCLTEPGSGSDAAALTTKAVRDGDHYVLNGNKAFISGGGESDLYVCMVRTGGQGPKGITCLAVEKGAPGLSFGKNEDKLGWNSHPTRAVIFENCRVPVSNRLGDEGQGFTIAMKGLDNGRINIAACSVGAAAGSIEFVVNYIKERKQFGKAISDFQFNQFRIAEMATQLQASRWMVREAARAAQEERPSTTELCAMAKYFATETCFQITDKAMQLMGGYGFIKEFPVQQYFRDCRAHPIIEGTNEIMRLIISKDIFK